MSDKDYILNDELLSAYIDGELSADERAAVDARLESDPAARQLLHQLRSVSESVQALPLEKPQHNFSDAMLNRVRGLRGPADSVAPGSPSAVSGSPSVVRGSPDPAPPTDRRSPGDSGKPATELPFFHSTRAWIWATLALAAGLLVMFVQSGDQSARKLPPVAQRSEPSPADRPTIANQPKEESLERARGELRRAPAPATPPPAAAAPESTTTIAGSQVTENVDELGRAMPAKPQQELPQLAAAGKPAGPAGATSSPARNDDFGTNVEGRESIAVDSNTSSASGGASKLAPKMQQPSDRAADAVTALGSIQSQDRSKVRADDRTILVVQVVATPDAFKNKSFDELLQKNGITLAPPTKTEMSLSDAEESRYALQPQSEAASRTRELKAAETLAKDLVLVEGSKPKIESLLAALNKNTKDYVLIQVNGESRDPEGAAKSRPTDEKTKVDSFSVYNRDAAASAGRGAAADVNRYYDKLHEDTGSYSFSGGLNELETTTGSKTEAANRSDRSELKPEPGEAHAVRVDWLDSRGRQLTEQRAGGGRGFHTTEEPAQRPPAMLKKLEKLKENMKSAPSNDTLKVLFVLTPQNRAVPSAQPATK